jgi:hypothetical protein
MAAAATRGLADEHCREAVPLREPESLKLRDDRFEDLPGGIVIAVLELG